MSFSPLAKNVLNVGQPNVFRPKSLEPIKSSSPKKLPFVFKMKIAKNILVETTFELKQHLGIK
jgi:hypothetical protein